MSAQREIFDIFDSLPDTNTDIIFTLVFWVVQVVLVATLVYFVYKAFFEAEKKSLWLTNPSLCLAKNMEPFILATDPIEQKIIYFNIISNLKLFLKHQADINIIHCTDEEMITQLKSEPFISPEVLEKIKPLVSNAFDVRFAGKSLDKKQVDKDLSSLLQITDLVKNSIKNLS